MAQERFDTIVGANVQIKGNLSNQGSIEIHGEVEGEITSQEDIIVGETATINGPVKAQNIDVSGSIAGSITTSEKLELQATSKVEGDISASVLSIKPGAVFNGSCTVTAEGEDEKTTNNKKPKMEVEEEE